MRKGLVSASILLLAAASAGPALAQGTGPANATPPAATPPSAQAPAPKASDISDSDITKFAQVNKKVQHLRAEYTEKLQASGTDQQKSAAIQREAQDKMVKAVEDSGLGVAKYNEIIRVAQADPALAQRIRSQQ